jgi:hypothetical protein
MCEGLSTKGLSKWAKYKRRAKTESRDQMCKALNICEG